MHLIEGKVVVIFLETITICNIMIFWLIDGNEWITVFTSNVEMPTETSCHKCWMNRMLGSVWTYGMEAHLYFVTGKP